MEKKILNLIILDKSGSMESIRNEAISGLNETVLTIQKAQKDYPNQKQFISILVFCGCEKKYIVDKMPAESVGKIKYEDYEPCCMTPLYDAMGKGIMDINRNVKGDVNTAVSVTVITDGYENASSKFSGKKIASLVEECKAKGWLFSYIGANQDVEAVAKTLSIENVMAFEASSEGTDEMFLKSMDSRRKWYKKTSCSKDFSAEEMKKLNKNYFND